MPVHFISMEPVYFKISREMRLALQDMAHAEDVTPGQLIRKLVNDEISRRRNARPPVRADEQLVAPLRARLAKDLAHAESWTALQKRLREKGYELREAGAGLALHIWPEGRRLCKASELGFSYSRLMRRLNAPFPGHTHHHLIDRYMEPPQDPEEEPEFDLIEREAEQINPS